MTHREAAALSDAGKSLREIATEIAKDMPCNCDLDNWEPEPDTGHSHVCRIHRRAIGMTWAKP